MKNKLQKLAPAWHGEAIELLKKNFDAIHSTFLDSTKKAVWLGIFLNEIKTRGKDDGSIPHGEFGPWMEKNLPGIKTRQMQTYMQIGKDVCEKGNIQIRNFCVFAGGELPAEALRIIEGKTQQQLFLEFRNPNFKAAGGKRGAAKETVEGKKEQARHMWRIIESDLQTGGKVMERLDTEELKRIKEFLTTASQQVGELIKLRTQK